MATISAWAVGSPEEIGWLNPRPTMRPPTATTAPIGTSPASRARRASSSAAPINASSCSRASVEIPLGDDWCGGVARAGGARPRGKHRAPRGLDRREVQHADRLRHVVVDGFDAAAHEVRLVPEAGAAGILQELLPPDPMRL